jgi:hypothetical protein
MKLESITALFESFNNAMQIFSREADPSLVNDYITKYKSLTSRHMISGKEKDITYWMNKGFEQFKSFVDRENQKVSKKTVKKNIKTNDSVKIAEFPSWTVIVPLSKEASCQYGKGTKWCTAATQDNHFDAYFYQDDNVLFYVISKKDNTKYAIPYDRKDNKIYEIFDASDEPMTIEDFEVATGINNIESKVEGWLKQLDSKIHSTTDYKTKIAKSDAMYGVNLLKYQGNNLDKETIDMIRKKVREDAESITDLEALYEYGLLFVNKPDELTNDIPLILEKKMTKQVSFMDSFAFFEDYINHIFKGSPIQKQRINQVFQTISHKFPQFVESRRYKEALELFKSKGG